MRNFPYLFRLIIIMTVGLLIYFNNHIFSKKFFSVNFNSWRFQQEFDDNFIFSNENFHWNFNIHSWINIEIQGDISHNIEDFLANNRNYSKSFEEKEDLWKYFISFGTKIQSSSNEHFFLILSEFWFVKDLCQIGCQSELSYLYLEAFNDHYRRISFNWSMKNNEILRIPSILRLNDFNQSECCSERFYPHLIDTDHHHLPKFLFQTMNFNKQRQMHIYDIFTGDQSTIFIQENFSSTAQRFYWIISLKPLKIVEYQLKDKNDHWNRLGEGRQLIEYPHGNYLIGLISIEISAKDCRRISRPHLVILTKIFNRFRLIYISEMFALDDLPIIRSYSTDFCSELIPGSIIQSDWIKDQILFTLSINSKKTFLIQINGIGRIVRSIVNAVETNYLKIFSNETIGIEMISTREKKNYEELIDRKQVENATEEMKSNVIKDVLQSPTYPTYQIASNTDRKNLQFWIEYDFIHYGLIGRFLTDYNFFHRYSGQVQSLMIDAGGNHGMYSLYSAMLNQTVFVFEILPKYWIVIQESIRMNSKIRNRIRLHKYGVSDQYQRLNVLPDDGTTRLIYPQTDQSSQTNLTIVETYPLDRFIFQRVSVMKIDVEGFEIRALKGALRAIRFFGVGAILIEIVPTRWIRNNITITEGITVLESVTSIGQYTNYVIPRDDINCPLANISNIQGLIPIQNLTMINMKDGHVQFVPLIYQFFQWKNLINTMHEYQWGCNFWLESSIHA